MLKYAGEYCEYCKAGGCSPFSHFSHHNPNPTSYANLTLTLNLTLI